MAGVRHSGRSEAGRNPTRGMDPVTLPVALAGLGLTWLAVQPKRRADVADVSAHFPVYEGYDEDDGLLSRAQDGARALRWAARRRLERTLAAESLVMGAVGLAVGAVVAIVVAQAVTPKPRPETAVRARRGRAATPVADSPRGRPWRAARGRAG